MAATGYIGHGGTLVKDPSGTPVSMTDIVDYQDDGLETDDIEITSDQSPSNMKEYTPGEIEPGTFVCTMNYKKSLWKTLSDLQIARTTTTWKYTAQDSGNRLSTGYVKKLSMGYPDQGKSTMVLTVKRTGTITDATS